MKSPQVTNYAARQAERFFRAPDAVLAAVVTAIQAGKARPTTSRDTETARYLCDADGVPTYARWNPATQRLIDVYPA
jgi:hypothetical protein